MSRFELGGASRLAVTAGLGLALTLGVAPAVALAEPAEVPAEQMPISEAGADASNDGEQVGSLPAAVDGVITLTEDVSFDALPQFEDDLTIDMGNHVLTYTGNTYLELSDGKSLTLKNGTFKATEFQNGTSAIFNIKSSSAITLDSVTMITTGAALFPQGDAASVTVKNSKIYAPVYAVATNAATGDNYNVVITLEDSDFINAMSSDGDGCAVMINVPGILNMKNCHVVGTRQALLVRGGTANIEDCTIELAATENYAELKLPDDVNGSPLFTTGNNNTYISGNWGSGNEVPNYALVVGNRSNPYAYPTTVSMEGTTVKASSGNVGYVYGMTEDGREVSFAYDAATVFEGGMVTNAQGSAATVGEVVAQVNGVAYPTLQLAIDSADDGAEATVVLLKDVTENVVVRSEESIVLDLNGHKISSASDHALVNNGQLTIVDSSGNNSGTIDGTIHQKAAILNSSGATLAIEGGTFTRSNEAVYPLGDGASANSWYTVVNLGTISKISGGLFTTGDGTSGKLGNLSSLIRNGDGSNSGTITLISGGTFISGANVIKNESNSTISSITGGTFTMDNTEVGWYGGNNLLQNYGTITAVTGGNFTAVGTGVGAGSEDTKSFIRHGVWSAGVITLGGDFSLTMEGDNNQGVVANGANAKVSITGGSVSIKDTIPGTELPSTMLVVGSNGGAIEVSGGSFSESVDSKYLHKSLTAELKSASNVETPYSYFTSVDEALKAAGDGDSVKDLTTQSEGTQTVTVTLDYADGSEKKVLSLDSSTTLKLPAPTRSGYTFNGWKASDGREYAAGEAYEVSTTDVTLTAQWTKNYVPPTPKPEPEGSEVSITETTGGKIEVDLERAEKGDTVTVTATADEGKLAWAVSVTDEDGKAIEVKPGEKDGTWIFEMPDGPVTVEAEFVCDGGEACPSHSLSDVEVGAWYHDVVDWAVENGIMTGYEGAGKFGPDDALTRAQLASTLYKAAGCPEVSDADLAAVAAYTDVDSTAWYADAIAWAKAEGIMTGYSDCAAFGPDDILTREQLAVVFWRIAGEPAAEGDAPEFPDASDTSDWADSAVDWAVSTGLLQGYSDTGKLDPLGDLTRAQMAAVMYRQAEDAE